MNLRTSQKKKMFTEIKMNSNEEEERGENKGRMRRTTNNCDDDFPPPVNNNHIVFDSSSSEDEEEEEEEMRVQRNKKYQNGRRTIVLESSEDEEEDDDDDGDDDDDDVVIDCDLDDDGDVEFTTEDVLDGDEDEDDSFADCEEEQAGFERSFERSIDLCSSSSSSSDDDDDGDDDFETPIVGTMVKPSFVAERNETAAGTAKASDSQMMKKSTTTPTKMSLFAAFRSPEAKKVFSSPALAPPQRIQQQESIVVVVEEEEQEELEEEVSRPPRSTTMTKTRQQTTGTPGGGITPGVGNKPMRLKGKTNEDKQFQLDFDVARKLYDHQRDAVRWLWDLHLRQKGGILADDMGLGKTMSSAAFIAGSLKSKTIKRALILAPTTLLPHWKKELVVCGLDEKREIFSFVGTKEQRAKILKRVRSKEGEGSVLLATYGMLSHNPEDFGIIVENDDGSNYNEIENIERMEGRGESSAKNYTGGKEMRFGWVVMDEGHQMKNPSTKIAQYVRRLPCDLRLVVSGTPIQNHLGELWALYDLAAPGLLGFEEQFRKNFARKITAGRSRDASERERDEARELGKMLRKICAPYFLRREKEGVLRDNNKSSTNTTTTTTTTENSIIAEPSSKWATTINAPKKLGRKNDLVAWVPLSKAQKKLYEAFLLSPTIREVLNKTGSALSALSALKKICDDPWLAFRELEDAKQVEEDEEESTDVVEKSQTTTDALRDVANSIGLDVKDLRENPLKFSAKLNRLHALLSQFKRDGKKVLVFSQSRYALDRCELVAKSIFADDNQVSRIDGNVNANVRHDRVTYFQEENSVNKCMLLTTKVGGLGITLTAATRVIIFDPSWNPTTDNQSVDRAYRIGQTENVVVYRMITIGTVEEKTYLKQVFKQGIANDQQKNENDADEGDEFRYFSTAETDGNVMFSFDAQNSDVSVTAKRLNALHAKNREYDEILKNELESFSGMFEVSDHDLLFSRADTSSAGKGAGKVPDSKLSSTAAGGKKKGLSGQRKAAIGRGFEEKSNNNNNWGGTGLLSSLAANAEKAVAVNVKQQNRTSGASIVADDLSTNEKARAEEKLLQLQKDEIRTNSLLANESLLAKLADNGEKALAKKTQIEQEIEQLRKSIETL